MILVISAFCGCGETSPLLEGTVTFERKVPRTAKEWPCTAEIRNVTDHRLEVALENYGATYTNRYTNSTGGLGMTIYSEPLVDREPRRFVTIEPGGVVTVPISLSQLPEIADKALDVRVHLYFLVRSYGRVRHTNIEYATKWSPVARDLKELRSATKAASGGRGEKEHDLAPSSNGRRKD